MRKICIALLLIFNFTITFASAEFTIIVNKNNPVSNISANELKNIYSMKKDLWEGGDAIITINLKRDNSVRIMFSDKILGKSPKKMDKYYLKRALSGRGQPPKVFLTEQDVINFVAMNKGGIGYVSKANVSVKVIDIK